MCFREYCVVQESVSLCYLEYGVSGAERPCLHNMLRATPETPRPLPVTPSTAALPWGQGTRCPRGVRFLGIPVALAAAAVTANTFLCKTSPSRGATLTTVEARPRGTPR